jgi:hypothetical protein
VSIATWTSWIETQKRHLASGLGAIPSLAHEAIKPRARLRSVDRATTFFADGSYGALNIVDCAYTDRLLRPGRVVEVMKDR